MANEMEDLPAGETRRRYTWPWWVLGAVVLAVALAVALMSQEVERMRRIRDLNAQPPQTDRGVPSVPAR